MAAGTFADSLRGSEWQPVELAGAPVPGDTPVFLRFDGAGRVAGNAGCNRFTGSFTTAGGTIAFGPLAVTRMLCPPPSMAFERAFLAALAASTAYARDATDLALRDAAGTLQLRLRQTDWD